MARTKLPTKRNTPVLELPEDDEWFCQDYVCTGNATKSYMKTHPGSRYNAAGVMACKLLKRDRIILRINELRAERKKRLEITPDKVLDVFTKRAFFDTADLYNNDGSLKPIHKLPPDISCCITGIEVEENYNLRTRKSRTYTKKIKLADATVNARELAKHLNLIPDRIIFPDKDGNPQNINNGLLQLTDAEIAKELIRFERIRKAVEGKSED